MPMIFDTPKDRIIVALDVTSPEAAIKLVNELGDAISFVKIGYQLGYAGGLDLVKTFKAQGLKVFVDLKLLDIDNTVAKGVESLAALGADFLTVHAYPKALKAAADATQGSSTTILAVSVLTSMSDADLKEAGYSAKAEDLVLQRAEQAVEAGVGGLVCSPNEIAAVRSRVADNLILVTPGVRPLGSPAGDQIRIATPHQAVEAGGDYLVIGRPITAVDDPRAAALAIAEELNSSN